MTVIATVRDTVVPAVMDATDPSYEGVLAYRDGPYRWTAEQAERFRAAGKLVYPITVLGTNPHTAQVADCENGDLTIGQAVTWAKQRNELHNDATIYVSLSRIPLLTSALGDVPAWLWVAWWTGQPRVPNVMPNANVRVAAVQYASLSGWDLSAIVDPAWPAHPFADMAHW